MLACGDYLKLQEKSGATKFLKPKWDIIMDYVSLMLVMIALVTSVVSLYAKDPICMPVIKCPARNNGSVRQEICAAYYNSSEHKLSADWDITILPKYQDRNLFDYVNFECKKRHGFAFEIYPNLLFFAVGACLVLHNSWIVICASTTDQFSALVKECYKYSATITQDRSTLQTEALFSNLQRKVKEFESETKLIPTFSSCRCFYMVELCLQSLIPFFAFIVAHSFFLDYVKSEERFECRIDEILLGFTYDYFICLYPLAMFYSFVAILVEISLLLYSVFMFVRYYYARQLLKNGNSIQVKKQIFNVVDSKNLAFLLNLLKLSKPLYLGLFVDMLPPEVIALATNQDS